MKELKNNQMPLIDVRTVEEFAQGHLPGAINIPLDQIDQAEIAAQSRLYCRSGRRSELAKRKLQERGIATVNLGGIEDYDGPIEHDIEFF